MPVKYFKVKGVIPYEFSHFTPAIIAQDKAFVASVRPVEKYRKRLSP